MRKGERTFNFSKTTSLFENPWSTTHSTQSWVSIVTHGPQRSWLSGACIWREKHKENVVGEQRSWHLGSVVGGGVTFDLCHKNLKKEGSGLPNWRIKAERRREVWDFKERQTLGCGGKSAGGWGSEGRLDRSTRSLLYFWIVLTMKTGATVGCLLQEWGGGNGSQKAMMGEERNAICYFCCPFTLCYWSPGGLKPC